MTLGQLIFILLILGVGALFLWYKLKGRLNDDQVRQFLQDGALVLDVRTEKEFRERHVDGAVHVPLDRLPGGLTDVEKDKNRVILCHCLGGGRSAIAAARLRRAGYPNAFNLGSLKRAATLVEAQQ